MGVFDIREDDIFEIRNPKWGNEYCRARATVVVEDEEWVNNQLIKIKQDAQQTGNRAFRRQKQPLSFDAQMGATNRLWVFRMLVDWTFTKNNMPMPLSLEAVKQLPQHVLDYIYEQIMKVQPKDEDETEQGEDENDTDPTMKPVSLSIVGAVSKAEKKQSSETGPRNFLSKS